MTEVYMDIIGANAAAKKVGPLTAGMVGVPVVFSFSPEWEQLNLLAVFRAGEEKKDNEIKDGRSVIPAQVLTQPGQMLCIGVEGRSKDGALVIPTVWAEVGRILDGAQASNDPALAPTPSQFERFMEGLEQVDEKLRESLRQAKESGEFNGTSVTHRWEGSVLSVTSASGTSKANLKGEPGYTPVKGVDYFTEAEKQAWESLVTDTVRYTSQNLTDVQKSQARENIGVEFGDKVMLEEVLALTSFALDIDPSHYPRVYFPKIDIVVGDTYVVHFNGQEYEIVASGNEWMQVIGSKPSQHPFVFGNAKLSDHPDETCLETIHGIEEATVSIHRKVTVTETIDPRFFPEEALLATPQTLTEEQKAQARANIGAAAIGEGDSAMGGADWNVSEGEAGYVANRTHWAKKNRNFLAEIESRSYNADIPFVPVLGKEYLVTFGENTYKCVAKTAMDSDLTFIYIGNASIKDGSLENTGEPWIYFVYMYDGAAISAAMWTDETVTNKTIFVYEETEIIHELSGKFLPEGVPYVENGITELLPETDASNFTHPSFGKMWAIYGVTVDLKVGETYTVTYNGTPYACVCQAAPAGLIEDPNAVAMGNFSVVGGANTGEPFAMLISFAYQEVDIIDLAESGAVKVKIAGVGEIAHKIDSRCLPDTLYVSIDISTMTADKTCDDIWEAMQKKQNVFLAVSNGDFAQYATCVFCVPGVCAIFNGFSLNMTNGEIDDVNGQVFVYIKPDGSIGMSGST